MSRLRYLAPISACAFFCIFAVPASACSLCASLQDARTFREDAAVSKIIVYGTFVSSTPAKPNTPASSKFEIATIIKTDPLLGEKKTLDVPKYVPVTDAKDPPHFILFIDVFKGQFDYFGGEPVKSADAVDYIKGVLALDAKDRGRALRYYFDFLENSDKVIAKDAFLEFAKASDKELGEIAPKLPADKLRGWIKDANTLDARLGMYAFLLGACGGDKDADTLRKMLDDPTDRVRLAYDGVLGGYIQLKPRDGWELAMKTLQDEKKPFALRYAVVRTLRFFHNWKPEDTKETILRGEGIILGQIDVADMAIEDLRRWQMWELTPDVLALHGKKGFDAPILRQAILRYALSCPKSEVAAAAFVAERRKQDPDGVSDAEDALKFLKQK
jgi:hypothetical protein